MPTIGILTISDTRTLSSDASGQLIASLGQKAGFTIEKRVLAKDDEQEILQAYQNLVELSVDVIITNGGTGIAKRDVTLATLKPFLVEEITGFGELFRYLSFLDIGSHAMASNAAAGFNKKDQLLFFLPGSPKACQLAMENLILKEVPHLLKERRKDNGKNV